MKDYASSENIPRTESRHYSRLFTIISAILVAFSCAKLIGITSTSPLIAYPDNWDFARVESCMGLWENYGPNIESHLSGPVNYPVLTRRTDGGMCAASIDTLFPFIVTRFYKTDEAVDLRYVGAARVAIAILMLIASLKMARTGFARLGIAVIFSLIFGEFGYIAYANTLFNEFAVLLGIFGAVTSAWLAWTRQAIRVRTLTGLAMVSIILLGMSKPQYSPLAPLFAAVIAVIFLRHGYGKRVSAAVFATGIASIGVYAALNPSDYGFGRRLALVNITDTVFTEVLPHATNTSSAMSELGLPQKCGEMIGKSFYSPGVDAHHPCMEVLDVSRAKLLILFAKQPSVLTGSLMDGVSKIRPFPGTKYGFFEDQIYSQSRRYRVTETTSFGTYLNRLPEKIYTILMAGSMLASVPLSLWCGAAILRRRMSWHGSELLLAIGSTLVLYSVASSVFGDGTTEVFKHAFIWVFGIALELIAIAGFVIFAIASRKGESSNTLEARDGITQGVSS